MRKILAQLICGLACVALSGCGDGGADKAPPAAPPGITPTVAPPAPVHPANTGPRVWDAAYQKDVEVFSKNFEGVLQSGDASAIDQYFDSAKLGEIIVRGLDLQPEFKAGFLDGVTRSLNLGKKLAALTTQGGTYHFLRCRYENGHPVAIFRVLDAHQGLNYNQFILYPDSALQFRIEDTKFANTGELLSESIRQLSIPALVEKNQALMNKLGSEESDYVKSFPKVRQMSEQLRDGQYSQALQTYSSLPVGLRTMKLLLLLRIRAASGVSPEETKLALNEAQTRLAGDPCLDLLLIDSYFEKKDFPKLVQCLDNLEKEVGKDAHLSFLRGFALGNMNKFAQARDELRAAIALEPENHSVYGLLLMNCLKLKIHSEVLECLFAMEKAGMDLRGVPTKPEFADFRASSEYKQWQEHKPPAPAAK